MYKREDLRRVVFTDLSEQCDEDVLYELCVQFGPVAALVWPTTTSDLSGTPVRAPYCFVDFYSSEDAKYCFEALYRSRVRLYDKEVHVSHASTTLAEREAVISAGTADAALSSVDAHGAVTGSSSHVTGTMASGGAAAGYSGSATYALHEVGAKVVVRNLDRSATEFDLTTFFQQFGAFAVPPRMLRDYEGNFRGIAILSYADFASSDRAIAQMHERVYRDRVVTVQYAELEDGSGRVHGSAEERENAALVREEERKYREKLARELASVQREQQQQRALNTSWADAVDVYAAHRTR